MMELQKHRGPDDEGIATWKWDDVRISNKQIWDDGVNGVIGFNRLSILDVSYAGHQPMLDPSGKVLLVFNGEIYNAFKLKEELLGEYCFKSQTDTEIILALYLKYGFEKTILYLNGMFALCIVDLRLQMVFLSRDRFGIKPLYYCKNDDVLYFASEYKSICMADLDIDNKLDYMALTELFNFRSTLGKTMLSNIKPFEPGEIVTLTHGTIKTKRYYNIDWFQRKEICSDDIDTTIWNGLVQSVEMQLLSNVPVGCQLSGGIDSALIAYIIAKNLNKKLDSVSIIFRDRKFTEEPWINEVIDKLGIDGYKYTFNTEQFVSLLETCVWHQESVVTHPNSLCLMWLTKKAKERVTVLLSGEGADELFGGYPRFAVTYNGKTNLQDIVTGTTTIPKVLRDIVFPANQDKEVLNARLHLTESFSGDLFDRHIKYEFTTYLPELLVRQDKMSMANSIENRVPFLDNNLVKLAFELPANMLCRKENNVVVGKYFLKAKAKEFFGDKFAYRKKMGFSVPLQNYIKNNLFCEYYYDLIIPGIKKRGIFNPDVVEYLYNNISEKKYQYAELEAFWRVLTTEIWCQLYLDKRSMIAL